MHVPQSTATGAPCSYRTLAALGTAPHALILEYMAWRFYSSPRVGVTLRMHGWYNNVELHVKNSFPSIAVESPSPQAACSLNIASFPVNFVSFPVLRRSCVKALLPKALIQSGLGTPRAVAAELDKEWFKNRWLLIGFITIVTRAKRRSWLVLADMSPYPTDMSVAIVQYRLARYCRRQIRTRIARRRRTKTSVAVAVTAAGGG